MMLKQLQKTFILLQHLLYFIANVRTSQGNTNVVKSPHAKTDEVYYTQCMGKRQHTRDGDTIVQSVAITMLNIGTHLSP